jgi:hypothetical protein
MATTSTDLPTLIFVDRRQRPILRGLESGGTLASVKDEQHGQEKQKPHVRSLWPPTDINPACLAESSQGCQRITQNAHRSSRVVMTTFRAVRLALDYFASVEGRKEARNLCATYGAASIPSDALKGASDAFHDTARRALGAARIGGNQEALSAYLLELWHMSFTVEVKQQRRKVDGRKSR